MNIDDKEISQQDKARHLLKLIEKSWFGYETDQLSSNDILVLRVTIFITDLERRELARAIGGRRGI